jgi:glycosyltransferase involved in cell wall biosynthesis
VLLEHECGVNVRQGDVDGLVTAIKEFADHRLRTERFGENARRALIDAYNRENACEQWRALLEGLVTRAAKARATVGAAKDFAS